MTANWWDEPAGLSRNGGNGVFVADQARLGPVVIDAADQASVCTVIDVAECF